MIINYLFIISKPSNGGLEPKVFGTLYSGRRWRIAYGYCESKYCTELGGIWVARLCERCCCGGAVGGWRICLTSRVSNNNNTYVGIAQSSRLLVQNL
ncbi:hypothetical protein QTP88_008413 [Uroleucon formosanum]